MEMLAKSGQLSASEISDNYSVSPPAISQHLKVLREAKLVDMEKRAQQHLYRINPEAIGELGVWVKKMQTLWHDRFDRLDMVLKEVKHGRSKYIK